MSETYDTHISCLICGNENLKSVKLFKNSYLVRCANCRFVFSKRMPTQKELDTMYYDNKYGYYYDYLSTTTITRYNELLDIMERYRKNNRLIDVGCGVGYFLDIAKQRGWEVFGTEYNDKAIEICRNKGISMHQGILNPDNYEPGYFDIITSFEVIEHINNQNVEIENFKKILRIGGLLYITTPNFNSFTKMILGSRWNIVSYPEHLSYYTPKTIRYLMKLHRFKVKKIVTTGISITRIKTSMKMVEPIYISSTSDDEQIRNMFEANRIMRFIKKVINSFLSMLGTGDSLKAFFEKI